MREITVPAVNNNVDKVVDFVNSKLESKDCCIKSQTQIDVAIDEIFSNIANYAYKTGEGEVTISVDFDDTLNKVLITFIDNGIQYNPLEKVDPDITLSAEEREIGGLGIYIVKKTMDEITYEYKNGQNILCLIKKMQ